MVQYIKQLDPVEGLIEYIKDIKPYHTKIIETEVECVQDEPMRVSFVEHLEIIETPSAGESPS